MSVTACLYQVLLTIASCAIYVEQQERIPHFHIFLFNMSFSTQFEWTGGTFWTVKQRATHLASQITPMCSQLLMNNEVSKYERLHFRNIYIGSIEKWQKMKLLITKDNKKGRCNTVSHSEMGFHHDRTGTLYSEIHRAKLFTNNLTIYYCL